MTKNIDLIYMGFDKQWFNKFQAEIDEFKELRNTYYELSNDYFVLDKEYIECKEKDENNTESLEELKEKIEISRKKCEKMNEEHQRYEISTYMAFEKDLVLPFAIDNEYGLDIIHEDVPIVFSYEQVNENLYCLWDVNHNISFLSQMYGVNLDRMVLFVKGIYKIKPEILALELTCDNGQEIIDNYLNGDISREEAQELLFEDHMSTSLGDDYTILLDYAREENIIIKAVDIKKEEYDNMFNLPDVTKDRELTENEAVDEISKYRVSVIKPKLEELTKQGKTMLILGAGHRPNLIDALKT